MDQASAHIKVVHLITLLEFGGAQGNTIHTVQNLDPKRFETHLWSGKGAYWDETVQTKLNLGERLRFFGSLVRSVNPLCDPIALLQLWIALRRLKPRILHTHSSKAGILGRLAGKMAGVPIIIHSFHGFGFNDEQKPWTRWLFVLLEKVTANFSTKLIFVSEANRQTARDYHIGNESQYVVIRSGVHLQQIRQMVDSVKSKAQLKESLGIPSSNALVLTIGPFKPQKNLMDFIRMAKQVTESIKNVSFIVVGDGELRPELEKQIRELKLEETVKLPGWRNDVPQLLSLADVFVLTSLWEGLPRSLVEAMAIGIPPVCYETDGVRDLLKRDEGTMVRQKDFEKLCANVLDVLTNRENHGKIAGMVRKRIGPDFDIDAMVRKQEELYLSLL